LQALIIINIFGTGVIILPRLTAEHANQDGWILVILATILACFCMFVISSLGRCFPDKSFYEYTSILVSKPIALVLSLLFVIRLIFHMSLTLRIFLEIVGQSMLPTSPFWVTGLLLLMVSAYGASKGYETRARLAEILIFIIFVPITLVFAVAAFNVDYSNILPIFDTPSPVLARGGLLTLSAFAGIELVLMVNPYITNYKRVRSASIKAVVFLGIVMTLITVVTIARFGIYDINNQMWPVIQMMDTTNLPGAFVQNQGVLIMSFFIISVFAIVNAGLFFSSLILKSIVKKGNHSWYVLFCMLLTFFASLYPQNMVEVYIHSERVFLTFGLSFMVVVPTILLIVAKGRRF